MSRIQPHQDLKQALEAADLTNIQMLGFIDEVATFDLIPSDKWDHTANQIFEHLGGTNIEQSDEVYYITMPDNGMGRYGYTIIFCDTFDEDDIRGSVLTWSE